ncbi:MAG: sodium:proton antiporter [Myxococcota bacterium]|nr:sodium:proton antiporter [Myxococcota bacterium]
MLPVVAVAVFLLVTVGVFLLLHRSLLRVVLGLGCLSHAVNLLVLSGGRWGRAAPLAVGGVRVEDLADPVPQAFVLTAIVISMAFTLYLLAAMATKARRGGVPEIAPAPESDGDRTPASLRAELEGREEGA